MIIFLIEFCAAALVVELPMRVGDCQARNYLAGSSVNDDCSCSILNTSDQSGRRNNACVETMDGTAQPGCMDTAVTPVSSYGLPECSSNNILSTYKNLFKSSIGGTGSGVDMASSIPGAGNATTDSGVDGSGSAWLENSNALPVAPSHGLPPPVGIPAVPVANIVQPSPITKTLTMHTTIIHRIVKPVISYVELPPVTLTAKGPTTTFTMPPATIVKTNPPVMVPLPASTILKTVQPPTVVKTFVPPPVTKPAVSVTITQKVQLPPVTSVQVRIQPPSTVVAPPFTLTVVSTSIQPAKTVQIIRTTTSYVTATKTIAFRDQPLTITYVVERPVTRYITIYQTVTPQPVFLTTLKLTDTDQPSTAMPTGPPSWLSPSVPTNINRISPPGSGSLLQGSANLAPGYGATGTFAGAGSTGDSRIILPSPLNTSSSTGQCISTAGVVCLSDLMSNSYKAGHLSFSCGISDGTSGCSNLPTSAGPSNNTVTSLSSAANELCVIPGRSNSSCATDINNNYMLNYHNLMEGGSSRGSVQPRIMPNQDASDENVEVVYLSDILKRQGMA